MKIMSKEDQIKEIEDNIGNVPDYMLSAVNKKYRDLIEQREVIQAEDMVNSDDWKVINILLTTRGFSKVKGERITPLLNRVNYGTAWIKTTELKKIFKNKTGRELQDI